jgi:multicomponent Na+:H+ antiporter subunit E
MYLGIIILWIILNGRLDGEILIFGILLSVVVSLFAQKVLGYTAEKDERIRKNLGVFLLYIPLLLWEILKASLSVAALSLSKRKPDPVIVEFHSGFESDLENVLLANSITLTPGTITLFQEGDHFVVHCLRKEYGEGLEDSSFVKLIRKMK